MKLKDLKKLDSSMDELEVFVSDPNSRNILIELGMTPEVIEVSMKNEFGCSDKATYDFPIGYKFLRLRWIIFKHFEEKKW